MIKRNMVKAGDILEWLGNEPTHMLMMELVSKYDQFAIWRALNMKDGKYEIVEFNGTNARFWKRVA